MDPELFLLIVFFVCVFIQTIYFIIFLTGFGKYKSSLNDAPPAVSVVICAHDEAENLRKLLPKLYLQDHPDFEIIVVDDRSNDDTYDLLLEETKKDPRLKMVTVAHTPEKFNGKKYGLTLGIKAAKNDVILLTDADCIPNTERWISTMAAGFEHGKQINLGISGYFKERGLLNLFIRFETIWTAMQYVGMALAGNPYMGVGRNLSYSKTLFISKKGFNNHLTITGGDDDLFVNQHSTKSNTTVTIGSDALVYSWPKQTLKTFFRQKIRHLSVGKYYRNSDKLILSLFAFTHVFFWLLLTPVLASFSEPYIIAAGFVIRMFLAYYTLHVVCKTSGIKFELWALIFLELIFVFYYVTTGITALFTKRVRWI